jgi:subtilisin
MRPAWAAAFDRGRLGDAHPLRTEGAITREWAFGDGLGAGVKVGIVDSGIEDGHPMVGKIAGAVAIELDPDDVDGDGLKFVEGPHEDLYGHGTACAGIVRTIAPEAELYSVRVLGAELTGRASVFAAGLRWAIENDMDVVNLSLSTSRGEWYGTFHELVDLAYFRRCVVVSAMNNLRMPTFPSEFASVVSVAAHSGTNSERFEYNPDGPAEFGAPGIDVEVAWSGGGTLEVTGNSFAAPHIAGMVARIMGQHPDATPFQVKTILHALADNARR